VGFAGAGPAQRFTGKERDAETGLDYFSARYMSAAQGRFTSPDPLVLYSGVASDPQSWNKYAYARNNPLLYTDPTGMKYTICDTSGNCYDDYSDADFDKNLGRTAKNDVLYDKDGNNIGTYQRTSFDDLSPFGNMFFNQMSARRQASNQFIGAFAAASVAVGTGGGIIANATGLTAGSGLTSLEIGSVASEGAASQLVAADLTYTQTVANNFAQAGGRARPYDLKLVVQEIMKGTPKPDPGGIAGGLRWDVPGTMNGSKGVYELVVNPTTKQIVHFLFKSVK
jgi:RHS repeat-associated protein